MSSDPAALPRRQRVAAYAVIVRGGDVLLSRLAPYLAETERWTLPGGGIDFGEHPDDAVVREVHEETGLDVTIGDRAWIDSARRTASRDPGQPDADMHSVRIVYEGWVPADSPEPHVVEVDGSTVDARWIPLVDVRGGVVDTVPMVRWALERHQTPRRQRLAAKVLVRRDDEVLLTRNSPLGPSPGTWTLPGGGIDHGEAPEEAAVREVAEETGLAATLEGLLGVHDEHFTGTAPDGREEDFQSVHLVYAAGVEDGAPAVAESGGTTDAVAWLPLADVESGAVPVSDVVRAALAMASAR